MAGCLFSKGGVRRLRPIGGAFVLLAGVCSALWGPQASASPTPNAGARYGAAASQEAATDSHSDLERAKAALTRYATTADRSDLREARTLMTGVDAQFSPHSIEERCLQGDSSVVEDVIAFIRLSNMLFRYTGQESLLRRAQESVSSLRTQQSHLSLGEKKLLHQAEEELRTSPLHITVVGAKTEPRARRLWQEAVATQEEYIRREWWDRSEGPLPNPDVRYPQLAVPAAFVCVDKRCSVPLYTDEELRERLAQHVE